MAIEQIVAGLQGLQQPEDQIDEWKRAWDEFTDTTLEGEEEQADTDTQRKRPDAWTVSWDKRHIFILELTWQNRCELFFYDPDTLKTPRYTPLRNVLARLLPGWEVFQVHKYVHCRHPGLV